MKKKVNEVYSVTEQQLRLALQIKRNLTEYPKQPIAVEINGIDELIRNLFGERDLH